MSTSDEFFALFGVAAYQGPAILTSKAWVRKHAAKLGPEILRQVSELDDDMWRECRALLCAAGERLELQLPSKDEDGLMPLARMFARRFLKEEVTMEVLVARVERIYIALNNHPTLKCFSDLAKDIKALQVPEEGASFTEDPHVKLQARAKALATELLGEPAS